jgi:hypothetical protein
VGIGVLAALLLVSPALGGPSLRSLVKDEVSKQLSSSAEIAKKKKGTRGPVGPPGPAGPQGTQGTQGNTGAAGSPAASAFLGRATGLTTTPIEFVSPLGTSTATFVPGDVEMASPNATMVARDLFVSANVAPGTGNSRQYELRLASSGSGILGCTMSGAAQTTCNSGASTANVPAGDGITLRVSNSGTPGGSSIEFAWRATTP